MWVRRCAYTDLGNKTPLRKKKHSVNTLETVKAAAARRNKTKLKVATFQRKIRYLGYTFGDGSRGHARQQAEIARDASKRVAARAYARVYLNVERGLWAWTMAARHHGEKFSAVWPRLDRGLS